MGIESMCFSMRTLYIWPFSFFFSSVGSFTCLLYETPVRILAVIE